MQINYYGKIFFNNLKTKKMARRRKTTRKSVRRSRSRKMGAISKSGLMDLAYNVAGGIAAGYVSKAVETALASQSSLSDKTKSAIATAVPLAVGFFMPQKSPALKNVATGMKIAAASKLVVGLTGMAGMGALMLPIQETPLIAGIEDGATDYRSAIVNNPLAMVAGGMY